MSVPMELMASDPYATLLRRIIDMRGAYELVCRVPPTVLWVNGEVKTALSLKGYPAGSEVAGMKIMSSPESIADQAICSRDADLFKVDKPDRKQGKKVRR